MIKNMGYVIRREDGEMRIPYENTITKLMAVYHVANNAEVGNFPDLSECVPFSKFVGAEDRRVNRWVTEFEGPESEILPLFVAAFAVNYIICKGNECADIATGGHSNNLIDRGLLVEKTGSAWFEALEKLPARELCYPTEQIRNAAMMLALGVTDEEHLKTGIALSNDSLLAVLELMAEAKKPFREVIQIVNA